MKRLLYILVFFSRFVFAQDSTIIVKLPINANILGSSIKANVEDSFYYPDLTPKHWKTNMSSIYTNWVFWSDSTNKILFIDSSQTITESCKNSIVTEIYGGYQNVWYLGGQSNAVGRDTTYKTNNLLLDSSFIFKQTNDNFEPLYLGVNNKGDQPGEGGIEAYLAPLVTNSGKYFMLVKDGEGGTSAYNNWRDSLNTYYRDLIDTIQAGNEKILQFISKPTGIKRFIWWQGEDDAYLNETWANAYRNSMYLFFKHLTSEVGDFDEYYIVRIHDVYLYGDTVRNIQAFIKDSLNSVDGKSAYLINTDDSPLYGNGHITGVGMDSIANRIFDKREVE